MHAYLLLGKSPDEEITKLISSLKATSFDYSILKIEDVRELSKLTKLKIEGPTAYIIRNVENATEAALNAFLKNLEEPQENLFYILTAENESLVLPTILSRCQIVKLENKEAGGDENEIIEFIKMDTANKLSKLETIKERSDTIIFLKNSIDSLHILLHKYPVKAVLLAIYLESFSLTLERVKGNVNVNLQLTNMVLSLVS
jgi:DNA polymerase-3 subunit delta'